MNTPQTPEQATHLAPYIDHTLLQPQATAEALRKLCDEAREFGFYSVCVYWNQVSPVVGWLADSSVKVVAVVGFPSGTVSSAEKANETQVAIRAGASEIDTVLNRELLIGGDTQGVKADIEAVVEAAAGAPVKVILETSELTDEHKVQACELAEAAGARFVKTSTGFASAGATEQDVALMRRVVGDRLGVKASGGIRTFETASAMIRAGASRLGTSASVAIVQGQPASKGGY